MTRLLLDVNILLAMSMPNHQHRGRTSAWSSLGHEWATTPITETAYVRLLINRALSGTRFLLLRPWTPWPRSGARQGTAFLPDDSSLADPAIDVASLAATRHVTDFHLLNFAVRHSMQLATLDGSLVRALPAARQHLYLLPD